MLTSCVLNYLILLLLSSITVIYFYVRNKFKFWENRKVKFDKPHWFFGSFGDFENGRISMAELTVNFYKRFKGLRFGGVWEFYSPKLFVVDPHLLRDILVKDFEAWSSRGVTVNIDVDPLAANLVNLDGKMWKSVRTKLTPTFTSGKLKQMHHLLIECGKELESHLNRLVSDGNGSIDVEVREISAKYTTDVIGSCIFGIQVNSLGDKESHFRRMGRKIFQPSTRRTVTRALQLHFPNLFRTLRLSSTTSELTNFFVQLTKANFSYREKHKVERHDFMDLLMKLKDTKSEDDEVVFDEKLLAAQAFIFFGAGFETSSSTISFCLHELAVNKNVQDSLREEIRKTKNENSGEITWDDLKNMKYLDMVFKETLRKYPPFPVIGRTTVKPYKISDTNFVLPEGTGCVIPIYAFHHDPEFYPDPETFDPQRFSDQAERERLPFTFIPFGGGPRLCIGMRFAEQQTKLALFKLVDGFEVSLSDNSKNPLQLNPKARFLLPKGGISLRLSHCVEDN